MNTKFYSITSIVVMGTILSLAPVSKASGSNSIRRLPHEMPTAAQVVVHKYCMHCNHEVSANSKVGQQCPFCHKIWGREATVTESKNSKQSSKEKSGVKKFPKTGSKERESKSLYIYITVLNLSFSDLDLDYSKGSRAFLPRWAYRLSLDEELKGVSPDIAPRVGAITSMVPDESSVILRESLPAGFGLGPAEEDYSLFQRTGQGQRYWKELGWGYRNIWVTNDTHQVQEYDLVMMDAKTDKSNLFLDWHEHLTSRLGKPTVARRGDHYINYSWSWQSGPWSGACVSIAYGCAKNGLTSIVLSLHLNRI